MAQNREKRSNKAKQKKKSSEEILQQIPEKIQALLSQAMKNHQVGLLDQAIISYRHILDLMPSYADANHLLGVALHQIGELEEGVSLIKKAIKYVPSRPAFHSNLGNVLVFWLVGPSSEVVCLTLFKRFSMFSVKHVFYSQSTAY